MATPIQNPRNGYWSSAFSGIVPVRESHYDRYGNLIAIVRVDHSATYPKGTMVNCGLVTDKRYDFYPCSEWKIQRGKFYTRLVRKESK